MFLHLVALKKILSLNTILKLLFNDDEEPTKQESSSFRARPTGNEGVTVDHWYNKLALEYVSES